MCAICSAALGAIWFAPKPFPWSYLWPSVNPDFNYADTLPSDKGIRWLALAYLVLSPALTEEVFFRGILRVLFFDFGSIPYQRAFYVIVSSLLFASVHWENGSTGVENAFIYGVVAAWLFLRLDSLWPLVAAHALVDGIDLWP